jgi:Protein of unknown function (DUF664)
MSSLFGEHYAAHPGKTAWTAPRIDAAWEPFTGDERRMLDGFLDQERATFRYMCEGLTAEQLARRSIRPSTLSMAGLMRHLADVERTFFRVRWGGQDLPQLYAEPFGEASAATVEADYAVLLAEQAAARDAVAGVPLDRMFVNPRYGEMTLRWAYLHMLREYAGHNGHASLIREQIDGRTGARADE